MIRIRQQDGPRQTSVPHHPIRSRKDLLRQVTCRNRTKARRRNSTKRIPLVMVALRMAEYRHTGKASTNYRSLVLLTS